MNVGTENRRKTILAGVLGTLALVCGFYIYSTVFGGDSAPTPPPSVAPVSKQVPVAAGNERFGIAACGDADGQCRRSTSKKG